jgi:MinD superfamily P-loop ATPase
MSSIREVMELANVQLDVQRSLTYEEYCRMMLIAVPHGPDEPCTCGGCGACAGLQPRCTCDIEWDLLPEIRDMWYA